MAFDFPMTPAPTVGQTFSPAGGPTYQWNGVGWNVIAPGGVLTNFKVFTASGGYVPSAGLISAIIECVGSGGGGGGTAASTTAGGAGGGGSGGYSRALKTAVQVGASQTVTIGAAGNGGVAGNNAGSNGADVSVGTLCIGKGGTGGGGSTGATAGLAGAGGVAGTGDLIAAGAPGTAGTGSTSTANFAISGTGGSSIFGGGGLAVVAGGNAIAGGAATNYGSGGGGAASQNGGGAAAGGNGSAGIAIITEFIAAGGSSQPAPGSRVLISQQIVAPASPVATIDFFYNFTNAYDLYELEIYDVQTTVNGNLGLRVSTDGSTFDASTGAYAFGVTYGTSAGSGGTTGATSTYGYLAISTSGGTTAYLTIAKATFHMPWTTDRYKHVMVDFVTMDATNGTIRGAYGNSYIASLLPLKGFRILPSAGGNFTRAVVNFYGIVKAGAGGS